jgi:hypothetical protein
MSPADDLAVAAAAPPPFKPEPPGPDFAEL